MTTAGAEVIKNRPAETGGVVSAAVVVLISYAFDIDDPAVIAAMTVLVGAIPGVITWCVVTFRKS